MDKEQLAEQYANNEIQNPHHLDAPYCTTLDRWQEVKLAYESGCEAAQNEVLKGKIEVLEEVLTDLCPDVLSTIINKLTQLKTELNEHQ